MPECKSSENRRQTSKQERLIDAARMEDCSELNSSTDISVLKGVHSVFHRYINIDILYIEECPLTKSRRLETSLKMTREMLANGLDEHFCNNFQKKTFCF
jgi:hypothetical protein